MENKSRDINSIIDHIAGIGASLLFTDEIWQCYGYKKRPQRGSIWYEIFPNKYKLDRFLEKELLTIGLIDVLNGIKKSTISPDAKLLLSAGVTDKFLLSTRHIISPDSFLKNLFFTYDSVAKNNESKIHELFILKANNTLGKKDSAKFLVGTIQLFATKHDDYILLDNDHIKSTIEKYFQENGYDLSISNEKREKYNPFYSLLKEKILNI